MLKSRLRWPAERVTEELGLAPEEVALFGDPLPAGLAALDAGIHAGAVL